MANTTLSTSAASSGVSGAAVVVMTWLLSMVHVPLPPDVTTAMIVLFTPAVHYLITKERAVHSVPSIATDKGATP